MQFYQPKFWYKSGLIFIFGVMFFNKIAYADGISSLNNFLQNKTGTLSADFTQTIYGNKRNQVSHGNMKIARPNKFLWQYLENQQLIVSDGKLINIYDKPLQQVTQKQLKDSLGKSPALLLAGGSNITSYYLTRNLPDESNLEWVLLTPKNINDNNGFQSVSMGFTKMAPHILSKMIFVDSFGNKSMIVFTNLKTGIDIPSNTFKFIPPKDVDVVSALNN